MVKVIVVMVVGEDCSGLDIPSSRLWHNVSKLFYDLLFVKFIGLI